MTLVLAFLGKTLISTILDSTPKRDACFSFLFLEMVSIYVNLETVSLFFRYMVKFSKYDDFPKKNDFGGGGRFHVLDYFR